MNDIDTHDDEMKDDEDDERTKMDTNYYYYYINYNYYYKCATSEWREETDKMKQMNGDDDYDDENKSAERFRTHSLYFRSVQK